MNDTNHTEAAVVETVEFETLHEVHESKVEWLKDRIAKLNRKAAKLGTQEITLTWGAEKLVERTNPETGHKYLVRFINCTVRGFAPRVDGWTFAATLSHAEEAGTIIRASPALKTEVPVRFRQAKAVCEHCGVDRRRIDTYLLVKDGEWKQVGNSCLADFLGGRDPHNAARMAEYALELGEICEDLGEAGEFRTPNRTYLSVWLQVVAAVVRVQQAWTSRKAAKAYNEKVYANEDGSGGGIMATADIATRVLFARGQKELEWARQYKADPADKVVADAALEWAKQAFVAKPAEERNDFEHNMAVVLSSELVADRNLGLAAATIGLHRRHLGLEAERAARAEAGKGSQHFGTVGERLVFWAKPFGKVHTFEGQFGTTFLYKLITREGNMVTWFSSGEMEALTKATDFMALIGTVKKHDNFRDEKQTVVNRVAEATQKQIDKALGVKPARKSKKAVAVPVVPTTEEHT